MLASTSEIGQNMAKSQDAVGDILAKNKSAEGLPKVAGNAKLMEHIVSTIHDISEQVNLPLNATIEAAGR